MPNLSSIQKSIVSCTQCPRLRNYCQNIAEVKRKAYRSESYWGKPIPGFGDHQARVMIVGLAPGAHGANRTGRVFTGDRSGDWLYRALYQAGFANQPESKNTHDGLKLNDAFISCVVKCAPPDNKPTLYEQKKCIYFLQKEIQALKNLKIWIALGQIAYQNIWTILKPSVKRPSFGHGVKISLDPKSNSWLLLSYHPSQQNTFTGRLTEPMFDSIFSNAKALLE